MAINNFPLKTLVKVRVVCSVQKRKKLDIFKALLECEKYPGVFIKSTIAHLWRNSLHCLTINLFEYRTLLSAFTAFIYGSGLGLNSQVQIIPYSTHRDCLWSESSGLWLAVTLERLHLMATHTAYEHSMIQLYPLFGVAFLLQT